ncbi:hypothetical protein LX87_04565 [Larkinella arboricola]|uniref:Uncharacterized protein n=1 Tax=Larkinella arboricola TaxID=643671 RepID=A0A327WM10_LARAB|nr:hypothetical protein LX87_04565 [Larkinella arboricola]
MVYLIAALTILYSVTGAYYFYGARKEKSNSLNQRYNYFYSAMFLVAALFFLFLFFYLFR